MWVIFRPIRRLFFIIQNLIIHMCFKKLFQKSNSNVKNNNVRTIKDLDIFDSIWVKDGNIIYSGWVFDISRRCIVVTYGSALLDYRFRLVKPYTSTEIVQGDKILYCNEP